MSTPQTSTTATTATANAATKTGTPSRFQKTAHGGLVAPPIVLPIIYLMLLYKREIPFWDHFFSIAYPLYLCFANRFRFDGNKRQIALRESKGESYFGKPEHSRFAVGTSWFPKHMLFAATLGLFLPIILQLFAPAPISQAGAPHLFVLVCQIMFEMMSNGPEFHPLLQLMVPLGFCAYRMSCLKTWLSTAWLMAGGANMTTTATTWEVVHLAVAVLNTTFWTCQTFLFLPLRVVPHCLDQNRFPDASSVTWYYMIPSVSNEGGIQKAKTRSD